jgi:hypothetical protein
VGQFSTLALEPVYTQINSLTIGGRSRKSHEIDALSQSHIFATYVEWAALKRLLESPKLREVSLNGSDLSVAEVIAVSL